MTPPTGRVAFLFTDVEGSTRRWERYGEAMRIALRRHDEILRNECESRDGYIFKTIGDAFCAAFPTAGDALEASVAAQRAFAREDFSAVDGLHVRMAIGAGEADERDGDYFGSVVNRTARLLSAGHGGQILLSGEAADLALPNLPPGVTLRHLGSLPLRDIKEPQRVYQPLVADLRSEFKALRSLETPPNNLPRQATSFVGRHDDLARIEGLLEEGPLVTVTGAGGIGKTRVALEVAAGRLLDERDGAWFVDLAAIGNAALIAGTILTTVGGELSTDGDPLEDLLAYLAARNLLLVLDNSEHLVGDVASIVAQIVARCAHVSVLATSRSPLDISGERIYRLSSLDPSAAAQLFAERARAANPSFRLEPKASIVDEICARLDGIALAIELAAARIRTMSVESLASHLELRLLAGGRDRRPRQQTMRALIDWSYDLLSQAERETLRCASLFVRGFTLETATAVCGGDDWQVLELLASLVDKSLLIVEDLNGEQRFRILEPIREYAYGKLVEAGELSQSRQRHATALAAVAHLAYEEWNVGPGPSWLARFEAELANLRTALRWAAEASEIALAAQIAADTTVLFLRLGLLDEGIELCNHVLEAGLGIPDEVEARVRYGLSMLYSNAGADQKCLEQALLAVPLYRTAGDPRGLARALSQVSSRHAWQSRYEAATIAGAEALQLARESGDERLLADVLRRCAAAFANGRPEQVREMFGESVALFRKLGRGGETATALHWWAQWEMAAANYREAAERLQEAIRLDDRDAPTMLFTGDIANCYLAAGEMASAEAFARRHLALAAKMRHAVCIAIGVMQLAVIAGQSDARKAARLAGYAENGFREVGWRPTFPEDALFQALQERLEKQLDAAELPVLFAEGKAWSEDQAVTHALS